MHHRKTNKKINHSLTNSLGNSETRRPEMHHYFADFVECEGYATSAGKVTQNTADDLVHDSLSSFSFHICFIQDILPFYR